jgi:hypothetical protein
MKQRLTFLSLLCTFLALAASDIGPPAGARFPGLNQLPALRNALGPKGGAILLHGSKALLAELEQHRPAFQKLGVGVATLQELPGNAGRQGWFLLDSKGVIAAKYFEPDASRCYTSAAILVHRFGWTPPGPTQEVEGKQLTATLAASNSTAAAGDVIALTVDIDLQPNMHVYAPGVEGYIPIDWKIQDSATVQAHAPLFPSPEKLYLKAIDETVPAYRNHFRLLRDIAIASGDGSHFSVDGSLRYQACDDRVCYIPQTLPLHWTFEYAAHP